LGTEDLKASKNGSVNSADSSTIREWNKEQLLKIAEDYKPNNHNADKTGLFFWISPNKT
jgi:hypothetical protein